MEFEEKKCHRDTREERITINQEREATVQNQGVSVAVGICDMVTDTGSAFIRF